MLANENVHEYGVDDGDVDCDEDCQRTLGNEKKKKVF